MAYRLWISFWCVFTSFRLGLQAKILECSAPRVQVGLRKDHNFPFFLLFNTCPLSRHINLFRSLSKIFCPNFLILLLSNLLSSMFIINPKHSILRTAVFCMNHIVHTFTPFIYLQLVHSRCPHFLVIRMTIVLYMVV